ncbi:MAG: hypothetical protein Kow00108_19170 [Calditrichia bacterium]
MNKNLYISIAASIIGIVIIEFVFNPAGATLLVGLSLMTAMVQGVLVFLAGAELSHGTWHNRVKYKLIDLHPLLYMAPIVFLIFSRNVNIYPWVQSHPNAWLTPDFMIWRNFFLLLVTAIIGSLFAGAIRKNKQSAKKIAVFYVLSYVTTNSFIGIDWVMSLEHPWISTMFPALYFVEGGMLGLAATIIFIVFSGLGNLSDWKKELRDYAILLLGFGLFWGGLQYAQFLTIWYGNLPEEVSYFYHRIHHPELGSLIYLVLIMGFVVPFAGLIPRVVKTMNWYVVSVAIIVIIGLVLERILHIAPVAEINYPFMVLELIILFIPFVIFVLSEKSRS